MLGPDGQAVGEVSEVQPGKTGEADMTFTKSGTYTFRSDKHRKLRGTFSVSGTTAAATGGAAGGYYPAG